MSAQSNEHQKRKIEESDSDDDVPLSELKNRVATKKDSDPDTKAKKESVAKSLAPRKNETKPKISSSKSSEYEIKKEPSSSAESDDSDDDVPIAVLMKRKQEALQAEKAAAALSKKPKVESKSSKPSSKTSSSNPKKKIIPSKKSQSASSSRNGGVKKLIGDPTQSAELCETFYSSLDKGKLCQKLLCRWWYAMSWPQEGVMDLCPKGYEPLQGFPGVFVGTSTKVIGNIIDKRDQSTCPCLRNFSKKSSQELKELCIKAYEEQIHQLIDAEGPNTKLERSLRRELQEIKSIKPEKADKQAEKLLKQPF